MKAQDFDNVLIFADGGCRGNGTKDAKAYGSFQVRVLKGDQVIHTTTKEFNFGAHTSNQAEYATLIEALEYIAALRDRHSFTHPVEIRMDSQLKELDLTPEQEEKLRALLTSHGYAVQPA